MIMEKTILKALESVRQNEYEEFKITWHFYDSEKELQDAIPTFKEWFEQGYSLRYEFETFTYKEFLEIDMSELKGLSVSDFLMITENIKKKLNN